MYYDKEKHAELIEKAKSEALRGFMFNCGPFTVFVRTDYKNKTQALASKILNACELPDNSTTRNEILYFTRPAFCEIKHNNNFSRDYFNIYGDTFGGYGSDDITDGKTILIEI